MYDKSGPDARAVYSARATTVTHASNVLCELSCLAPSGSLLLSNMTHELRPTAVPTRIPLASVTRVALSLVTVVTPSRARFCVGGVVACTQVRDISTKRYEGGFQSLL